LRLNNWRDFSRELAAFEFRYRSLRCAAANVRLRESTMVEFVGLEHVIFISSLPLEFDDNVRLEGNRKSFSSDATVVAVQYHDGRKAVAVKFLRGPCHWIMPL